jgi:hypothetical protein
MNLTINLPILRTSSLRLIPLATLLATFALSPLAVAQTGWMEQTVSPNPGPQTYHALAHDTVRDRTVLKAGSETWEWDGAAWTEMSSKRSPSARNLPALAFDQARQVCVLFGGYDLVVGAVNDTWTWDGQEWTQQTPSTNPPSRLWHSMVYDSQRQRVVMFGGYAGSGNSYHGDTWEWDGQDWAQVVTATRPTARGHHAMAYDANRGRVVLFGGHRNGPRFGDTWEYDGSDWQQAAPTAFPSRRAHAAMAYDEVRQTVVLFGGWEAGSYLADTWEWNGTTWKPLRSVVAPTPRGNQKMVFQPSRSTLFFFGGNSSSGNLGDTWEGSFPIPFFTNFGAGCPGTQGVPTLNLVPGQEPRLGSMFQLEFSNLPALQTAFLQIGASRMSWNGVALPMSLGQIGMPGCSLYVSPDVFVPLVNLTGSVRWQMRIPEDPSLVGGQFYVQGFVADNQANPLGMIASAAGEGQIGY